MELTLEWLKKNKQHILFESIYGSHAYGTAIETSDKDIRGVFIMPQDELLGLDYVPQIGDDKNDTVYYEIGRFCELLLSSNTTVLEMLFMPEDCILHRNLMFQTHFISNRDLFLTKDLVHSLSRMARAQIKKATGLKKKMHIDESKMVRKVPLDFCYVPYKQGSLSVVEWLESKGLKQENCGLVKVPNMRDGYTLFHSLEHNYKGIMKKDNANDVSLSSIPKGEEPLAFMQFNKDAYTVHCTEWRDFQEWKANSNKQRYVDVNNHGQQIDGKNMLHCTRVIQTLEELVETNKFVVRRSNRDELLSIRRGEVDLKTIVDNATTILDKVDNLLDNSTLPLSSNKKTIVDLLVSLRKKQYAI